MPFLASWNVVVLALLIILYWDLLTPTAILTLSAIPLFLALAAPFIQ